jgi:ADP-L-glycero-D-manno-heptose 6-epimerase
VIAWHGRGDIEYVAFPESLKGRYQSYTQASHERLRAIGHDRPFLSVEDGVRRYLDWLNA